jgi:hypothetical protein
MSAKSTCIPGRWQGIKGPSAVDKGMLPENLKIEEYHENLSKRAVVQLFVSADSAVIRKMNSSCLNTV